MTTIHFQHKISLAPMMAYTDRHFRYLIRLLSPNTLLYTEMVTTGALVHGKKHEFLKYSNEEHPIALQLGGSNPKELALCARMAEDYGYDEINLNVGCPSDRVQAGRFGACLMKEPDLVAECVHAMQQVVNIPVTVKTRIGVDDEDSYEALCHFIKKIHKAGCQKFIIHARKAWLQGLSPKENREVPPLRYDIVYSLKRDFPDLHLVINGGVKTIADVEQHLQILDGVMIGREAYANPLLLAQIEQQLFNGNAVPMHFEVLQEYLPYLLSEMKTGVALHHMTRHLVGLFKMQPNAKKWRQLLCEQCRVGDIGVLQNQISLSAGVFTAQMENQISSPRGYSPRDPGTGAGEIL